MKKRYSLTKSQKRLWFEFHADNNSVKNISLIYDLRGEIDPQIINQVMRSLVVDNEIFRSTFSASHDRLDGWINDNIDGQVEMLDLSTDTNEAQLHKLLNEIKDTKFQFTVGPLFRFALIKVAAQNYRFAIIVHPLVLNRFGIKQFVAEINNRYLDVLNSKKKHKKIEIQYQSIEYTLEAEKAFIASPKYQSGIQYFANTLKNNKFLLQLPASGFYPEQLLTHNRIRRKLSPELSTKLRNFAGQYDTDVFTVLLAAYQVLLARYSGSKDIIINHSYPVVYNDDNYFSKLLPLRNYVPLRFLLRDNLNFIRLVTEIKMQHSYDAFYSACPINDVIKAIRNRYDTHFDGSFTNIAIEKSYLPHQAIKIPGVTGKLLLEYANKLSKENLVLYFNEEPEEIPLVFEIDGSVDSVFIEYFADHLVILLTKLLQAPEQNVFNQQFLLPDEHTLVVTQWNQTATPYPQLSIAALFNQIAKQYPDNIAVVLGDQQLTYRELDNATDKLASYLIKTYQEKIGTAFPAEALIGLSMRRSLEMLICTLAIVKAGGAYVPLDPNYPEDRLRFMLRDTGIKIILTQTDIQAKLGALFAENHCEIIDVDREKAAIQQQTALLPLPQNISPNNLLYIIYTSGSTGEPKGAMIEHHAVVRLVKQTNFITISPYDHLAQASNIAFDAATLEIWGALLNGATLYLVPADVLLKTESFAAFLAQNEISILWLTVALFNQYALENPNMFGGLNYLMAGGDALTPEIVYRVLAAETAPRNLLNGYGPTENTTFTATYSIKHELPAGRSIPIGQPIANTTCYILDDHLCPVPIGVEGELYAGGAGVARGYLHREQLTAEKFVINPFSNNPNDRLYKTGDVVRWLPDGNIEFVGRKDTQVKIRGFRIEIGEIEHAMLQLPIMKQAVVVVCQHPQLGKLLAAYFVTKNREIIPENELRKTLGQNLPEYMLPTYFIQMDILPITPNGKVDKRALPDPFGGKAVAGQKASNAIEAALLEIWEELFAIPADGLDVSADFFELGGHSLLATQLVSRVRSRLSIDLPVKAIFQNSSIKLLANYLSKQQAQRVDKFTAYKADKKLACLPLSFAEQRVYFLHQLDTSGIVYNIPFLFKFSNLDTNLFTQAFNILIQQQEILRTAYVEINNEVCRKVLPQLTITIPVYQADEANAEFIKKLATTRMDLAKAPLFIVALIQHPTGAVDCFFNIHHIIFDGWSLQFFLDELGRIYTQLSHGKQTEVNRLTCVYSDYAYSQQQWYKNGCYTEQLDYWMQKLSGELPILDLPTDYQHPSFQTFNGDVYHYTVPERLSKTLKTFCRTKKVSLFSLLLTIYNILLYRYTGETDILIGAPIANRLQKECEKIIGLFMNLIVHRNTVLPSMTFENLLREVQQEVIEANENQGMPFDMLVNKIKPPKQVSQNPIFQTLFVLQSGFKISGKWEDTNISYRIQELHQGTSRADIVFIVNEDVDDRLSGYVEYNNDMFSRATMERIVEHFLYLLNTAINYPSIEISALSVLTTDEYQSLVIDNNKLPEQPPVLQPVPVLFNQIVQQYPNNIAVVAGGQTLTYKQLDERANQLANYLRQFYQAKNNRALTADTLIGLCLGRDLNMVIAMLAILKAGAAYLPLDPDYPIKRLEYMVQDANLSIIVTLEEYVQKNAFLFNNSINTLCLDREQLAINKADATEPNNINSPYDLAYVIYTSGSTGQPKGVMVEHKGIPNLCEAQIEAFAINQQSHILQFASINFDAATSEVYTALLAGATLYIVPDVARKNPELLYEYLASNAISVATIPPAVLELLPQQELPALKTLVIAGDVCDAQIMQYWSQGRIFINAYGPTETTVCATLSKYDKNKLPRQIGTHIKNLQTYVLDKNLQPVPIGVPGELYVSGIGLARGYLHRPDLTIERFVAHPFTNDPQTKMYQTGDLVRWLPVGELEFLGRGDAQVKIRGFRVELGEIESLLSQYSGILQAVVIVKQSMAGKDLIAFYVAAPDATINTDNLRSYLANLLPAYMVPAAFIELDKMPLNPSGKIDRKVLEKTQQTIELSETKYVAPITKLEKDLATIWATLLNHKKISLYANFFTLGGHSLLAVKMQSMVRQKIGKDFNLLAFIQNPVLKYLSELLTGDTTRTEQKASGNLTLALQDAATTIQMPKNLSYAATTTPQEILLTGVTGFMGVYLLDALLRRTTANIHCIIRSDTTKKMQQKFAANLSQFAFEKLLHNPRIHLLRGDIAQERLGLDKTTFQDLTAKIDTIYHNGAWVHHIFDYKTLRATNVNSTITLLNMAISQRIKALHYISTFSCATSFAEDGSVLEGGPAKEPTATNGYSLTKWVCERILWQARANGALATIYRPGNVTGNTQTGQINFANNHFLLFVKSCIQLGVAPLWDMKIEMEPVDILCDALVAISLDKNADHGVYNLVNPNMLSWQEYIAILNQQGFKVKLIDPATWLNDYLMPSKEDNALYALKALYEGQAEYSEPPKFYCDEAQAVMHKHGLEFPKDYSSLVKLYNDYLIKQQFLPRP